MAEQGQRKPTKEERARNLLRKDAFAKNAVLIFSKAVELNRTADRVDPDLLKKMLHSILFLGNIHLARYPPEAIFDDEIFGKEEFKEPFDRYKTHVAVRTPFSYFLELVVSCASDENEVKTILSEALQNCRGSENDYALISSVICICQVSGRRYYGASLSCSDDLVREIMTAVSCFHVWHPYVSSAVSDVFPEDKPEPRFPHGTVILPSSVQCRAYGIEIQATAENRLRLKAPCARCHELYSLPDPTVTRNNPGNCAETEAISNLLKKEEEVRNRTTMNGGVIEKRLIEEKMRNHFNSKMKERMEKRKCKEKYSINGIYNCE